VRDPGHRAHPGDPGAARARLPSWRPGQQRRPSAQRRVPSGR
jgi:hypothetical protein